MIEDEIGAGESNRLEFKKMLPKDAKKYVKSAVAFSNSQGGKIIFGVTDEGRISGLEGDLLAVRDSIVDEISNRCTPQIFPNSYISTIDQKGIVVVDIAPGAKRPYYVTTEGMENGTYIRIDASTRLAGPDIIRDLMMEGSNKSFDILDHIDENEKGLSMESVNELCLFLSEKSNRKILITDLVNLKVLRKTEGGYVPSRAFMLLTENPYDHARIQCARFIGPHEVEFADRQEYTGSIIKQVDDAVEFVMSHTFLAAEIKGVYRKDVPEVPPEAVRELVTNAVVHRSYSMENSPIFVAVFDNRIEITSPGFMPFGITIDSAMSGHSNPRNKVIAGFFRAANLTEGWGSGIRRCISLCEEYGLKPPEFQELGSAIRVTLFRAGSYHIPSPDVFSLPIDDLENAILNYLENNPEAKISDIVKETGASKASVERAISKLKAINLLSRRGNNRVGKWTVKRN
ncbi:MAG: putative DNA binding domain-containing protein [Candidatus Methanoplasma sp.]|jgi:predicted HTH transcriptional regulator|nr:putative DNA binding domain-containing protein [Candidatus Methanoplasma sp.]